MSCSPELIELLKKRLADAEQAQHDLMTGRAVRVLVDQNGERIEYTTANAYRLATYIAELQRRIAACSGNRSGVGRPMKIFL